VEAGGRGREKGGRVQYCMQNLQYSYRPENLSTGTSTTFFPKVCPWTVTRGNTLSGQLKEYLKTVERTRKMSSSQTVIK
jgi:hypothetical protein